jgi:hypothetical protein
MLPSAVFAVFAAVGELIRPSLVETSGLRSGAISGDSLLYAPASMGTRQVDAQQNLLHLFAHHNLSINSTLQQQQQHPEQALLSAAPGLHSDWLKAAGVAADALQLLQRTTLNNRFGLDPENLGRSRGVSGYRTSHKVLGQVYPIRSKCAGFTTPTVFYLPLSV